jgi:hypothetical protein
MLLLYTYNEYAPGEWEMVPVNYRSINLPRTYQSCKPRELTMGSETYRMLVAADGPGFVAAAREASLPAAMGICLGLAAE